MRMNVVVLLAIAALAALLSATSGWLYSAQGGGQIELPIRPPIAAGDPCVVQIRRDVLATGLDLLVPPMLETVDGQKIAISGEFRYMDDQWIVLYRVADRDEVWIPRDMVLLLRVDRRR